jgi:hypothetical protein
LQRNGPKRLNLPAGWRVPPKGGKRSLREISAALAEAGHTTKSGNPYAPTAIKLMLERSTRAADAVVPLQVHSKAPNHKRLQLNDQTWIDVSQQSTSPSLMRRNPSIATGEDGLHPKTWEAQWPFS